MTTDRSHPNCWTGERYAHTCARLSGRQCLDCGAPAGTPWGPYWCPDCDVRRLDRITDQLDELREARQRPTTSALTRKCEITTGRPS